MLTRKRCCCGANCGSCCSACSPCQIPKADLTVTWTQGSGAFAPPSGSGTMVYISSGNPIDGGEWWRYYPDPPTADGQLGVSVFIYCHSGVIGIAASTLISTSSTLACGSGPKPCWTGSFNFEPGTSQCLSLNSHTCNPFHLYYLVTTLLTGCATATQWLADITIDGPEFGSSTCCQTFSVVGCFGAVAPGATVSIYDTMGGTLLASGTTNSSGVVRLFWSGSCSVYVTASGSVSQPWLFTYGQSLTLTPNGTKGISLFPTVLYGTLCGTTFPLNLLGGGFAGATQVFSPGVCTVTAGCVWDLFTTQDDWTIFELSLSCPTGNTSMSGLVQGCIKGFGATNALCPGASSIQGISCPCGPAAACGQTDPTAISLSGTIGPTSISLSGTMPSVTPAGLPLPCAGQTLTVTN